MVDGLLGFGVETGAITWARAVAVRANVAATRTESAKTVRTMEFIGAGLNGIGRTQKRAGGSDGAAGNASRAMPARKVKATRIAQRSERPTLCRPYPSACDKPTCK